MTPFFNTIRDNLTRCYIFYIPDSIFEDLNKTYLKGVVKRSDLNKLAFFDKDLNILTNIKVLPIIDFITKSKSLDENIVQLLKAKEALSNEEFKFIVEAYKEHVGAHAFITEQLYINLKIYIKDVEDNIESLFKLQAQSLDKHINKVREYFGKVEKPMTIREQQIIKHFKDRFSKPRKKIEAPKVLIPTKTALETKSDPKPKKKPLLSNEEADLFLLKTVFNVTF